MKTHNQLSAGFVCQSTSSFCPAPSLQSDDIQKPTTSAIYTRAEKWKIGLDELVSGNHTNRSMNLRPKAHPRVVKRQPPCEALEESVYYCLVMVGELSTSLTQAPGSWQSIECDTQKQRETTTTPTPNWAPRVPRCPLLRKVAAPSWRKQARTLRFTTRGDT